jgi:short-subunit dehydrogenase
VTDRPTALITGASDGIGAAFARLLAERGHDLILVARTGAKMEEIAQYCEERHGVATTVLPKDLSHDGAAVDLADQLDERGLTADVLINSAGFAQWSPFAVSDERALQALVRLNMETLTLLTRRMLPGMIERGRGRVVNLASNAAFQPGPGMAAYYASKAYVLNLSIALAHEVRGTGVTVTALCPGPTRSGFQDRAAMGASKVFHGRRLPSAEEVAAWGWQQAERGTAYAVHGARWRTFATLMGLLPRRTAAALASRANERAGLPS